MSVDAADAQAAIEGVDAPATVSFMGEDFTLPDRVSFWAFIVFAKAAKLGLDSGDAEGMAAMFDMVHGCLSQTDGERFDRLAIEKRATDEEIMSFVQELMEAVAARPTGPRSDSSQPPRNTSKKLKDKRRSPEAASELKPVTELAR
jgi:hypothetical protein